MAKKEASASAELCPLAKRNACRAKHSCAVGLAAKRRASSTLSDTSKFWPSNEMRAFVSIARPNSLLRSAPAPSKFSNKNPSGSITAWQLRQRASLECSAKRSRVVFVGSGGGGTAAPAKSGGLGK